MTPTSGIGTATIDLTLKGAVVIDALGSSTVSLPGVTITTQSSKPVAFTTVDDTTQECIVDTESDYAAI